MDQWYYAVNGQQLGPVPFATLQQLAASGQLSGTDLIWREGMAAWTPAAQVAGVFSTPAPPMMGGPPQYLNYVPPPVQSNTGLIVSGYICSSLGVICCIFVAVAGLVIGIILLKKNEKTHGTWITVIAGVGLLLQIGLYVLRFGVLANMR